LYNRYIRNDRGVYTRIPQEEPGVDGSARPNQAPPPPPPHQPPPNNSPPFGPPPPPPSSEAREDTISRFLRRTLNRFHLESVDTGDLLLLAILFLLFEEDADEELLIALGLMLIL